ncbi:MAG TPA: pitrilysin family protein [bacterium]|jgi:predicted Zn-dependent peptidase|nr:pitrilysin family protein [bacterium]HOQ91361.1 pitrilysin family protein [bacterium]HPL22198.1 pitrilysin family protein [bacterium]
MWQRQISNERPLILKIPLAGCPTFTALVVIAVGSKYETANQSGLSHFLEHMFFKGTSKRPSTLAISSELDAIGGEYNAFTSKEYTGYYVKCAADQAAVALDVLSDMLLNSQFSSEEIDRERGVIIEEINMYQDNPMLHLEDVFEQTLYGDTPAGWDTAGRKETVSAFQRDDFINYWRQNYGQQRTIICLAGQLPENIDSLVNKYFAQWPAAINFQDKLPVVEQQSQPQLLVADKDTDQLHLALGVRAFPYGHPQRLPSRLLAAILGGSMSSRLFLQIRERQGLAYYVRTSVENYTDSGYLVTSAGIKKEAVAQAVATIIAEYKKLTTELVDAAELERIKKFLSGRLILGLEGSDDLAQWYARQQVLFLGQGNVQENLDTPTEYLAKIRAVTAEQIQSVARQIFVDQGLNLAIIGRVTEPDKLLAHLSFN